MIRLLKEMFILFVAAIAVIYLLNPSFGLLELIPDNVPLIGNMDEAGVTLILLSTLKYYGLDLTNLYGVFAKRKTEAPQQVMYVERPPERK